MVAIPGQEFGNDFYSYVLDRASTPLSSFIQTALPTSSGLNGRGMAMPGGGVQTALPGMSDPNFLARLTNIGDILAQGQQGVAAGVQKRQENTLSNPAPKAAGAALPTGTGYAPNVANHLDVINQVARETGVPARVLASLIHIENYNDNPAVVRPDSGAAGLMQVVGGPTDPYANITAGANLLREKQKAWGIAPDDWANTAAAYFGAYHNGSVTDARDATGTSGNQYVNKFNSAYNLYPAQPALVLGAAGQRQAANPTGAPRPTSLDRPSQFDPSLTSAEQYAACGPVGAVAFAQRLGQTYSVRQAMDIAENTGLWARGEMQGPNAEVALLARMGVAAKYVAPDWQHAVQEVDAGRPVLIDTPGHYYYADGYDANTGAFHVGTSGTDTSAKAEWMTPQQMSSNPASQGNVRGIIVAQ